MQQSRKPLWRVVTALFLGACLATVAAPGCASSDDDNDANLDIPSDDAGASCPTGQTECQGICVDTKKDRSNCGACGSVCAPGYVCANGLCAISCPGTLVECNSTCVNLQVDRFNCGECGNTCAAGEVCWNGKCDLSCQEGLTECGGTCVNLDTDRENCGQCGKTCADGEVCADGECALSCPSGLDVCDGTCVNLDTDRANCGECGKSCEPGEVCSEGECALSCQSHLTECNGSCVNTLTDRQHCGACNEACNPGEVCSGGNCILSCPDDMQACGGTCVNTNTDRTNCGQCGKVCDPGEVCSGGECALSCQEGLTNCDGSCVNLDNDRAHCGSCTNSCSSTQICDDGSCVCLPGQTACGIDCVDLSTNSNHCGSCNNACGDDEVCVAGECTGLVDGNGELKKEGKPKVAFVGTAGSTTAMNNNLRSKLGSLDMFDGNTVDLIAITDGTPTLDTLRAYDVIGFFQYSDPPDADALGNVLADYFEAGGGIVFFSVDSWSLSRVTPLGGRYAAQYGLLPIASAPTSMAQLGDVLEPSHPIMAGVTTFACKLSGSGSNSCYHNTGEPQRDAIVVAKWSDGKPLVLRRDFGGREIVEMNFSPYFALGGWDESTDGAILVKNALLYVVPKALTAAKRLDLGNVPVYTAAPAQTITYRNTSGSPLTITAIEVTGAHLGDFVATPGVALPVTLNPGQTLDVGVVFTPSSSGLRAATVSATVDGYATKLTTLLVGKGI